MRPKRCIAEKNRERKKLRGLAEMDKQIRKIVAQKQSSHLSTKRPVGVQNEWIQCRQENNNKLNSSIWIEI